MSMEATALGRFFDEGRVHAVRDTSFRIDDGEFVVITGKSGSGKSTLLNLLGLLDRPTTGNLIIDDASVMSLSEAERTRFRGHKLGFVFQDSFLDATRTTTENVMQGLRYAGLPRRERRRRAIEALEAVDLGHRLEALPGSLSGGERQRVAFARAVAHDPPILLCDEPTGNLDSANGDILMSLIRERLAGGTTAILVTHDTDLAVDGDRHGQMIDGVFRWLR